MTSYYNIFKDTEFIIQNTDTTNIHKLFNNTHQTGGNLNNIIYEDINSKFNFSKEERSSKLNDKFIKSCKQSKIQNFKQPMIQISGFNFQL